MQRKVSYLLIFLFLFSLPGTKSQNDVVIDLGVKLVGKAWENPLTTFLLTHLILIHLKSKVDPSPLWDADKGFTHNIRDFFSVYMWGIFDKNYRKNDPELSRYLWRLYWEFFVGFPGKSSGLKVSGSDVFLDGVQSPCQHVAARSLSIHHYDSIPPYGFIGCTWAALGDIFDPLKKASEMGELAQKFTS
jgi:hypothetical protein